jgi:restriction endonuclease S subunit
MAVWSSISKKEVAEWHRMDAEFWRPEYIAIFRSLLQRTDTFVLGKVTKRMRKGIFDIPADEYVEQGIPFLRVSNVKPVLLNLNNLAYVSDARNERESKTCFRRGDVVLNKTGDIGAAVINLPVCNISQDLIGLEIREKKSFNGFYLAAFLNTTYGQMQLRRWFQGQVQMHLALSDARKILVPFPSEERQGEIEQVILSVERENQEAERLYTQAEELVLKEVRFDRVELNWAPGYVVSAKEARDVNRVDAEHFQPKYGRLLAHIEKTSKAVKLNSIAPKPHRGAQPRYVEGGEVLVVNSQHLGRHLVNAEGCERTDERDYNNKPKASLRKNDVLIYATGAYVGRTNVWLEEAKAMASNHVTIVRPKKECDPRYLAVFLNSPLGIMQADSWATGSAQRELYPQEISRFTVFLPDRSFQLRVGELVTVAYQARAKAKRLLEEAKSKVEALLTT